MQRTEPSASAQVTSVGSWVSVSFPLCQACILAVSVPAEECVAGSSHPSQDWCFACDATAAEQWFVSINTQLHQLLHLWVHLYCP